MDVHIDVAVVSVDDTRGLFDDFGWAGWVRVVDGGGVLVDRV